MTETKVFCQYDCPYHRGKIEWHHPISGKPMVGLFLCEAHHSVLQGRKKRYLGELAVNKSLAEMKEELQCLQNQAIVRQGGEVGEIDKR